MSHINPQVVVHNQKYLPKKSTLVQVEVKNVLKKQKYMYSTKIADVLNSFQLVVFLT